MGGSSYSTFFPFWFPLKTPLLYHNSFEYHSVTCWGHIHLCDNKYETVLTLLFVVNPFIKYLFGVILVLYIYDLFVVPKLYHDWYIHHIKYYSINYFCWSKIFNFSQMRPSFNSRSLKSFNIYESLSRERLLIALA